MTCSSEIVCFAMLATQLPSVGWTFHSDSATLLQEIEKEKEELREDRTAPLFLFLCPPRTWTTCQWHIVQALGRSFRRKELYDLLSMIFSQSGCMLYMLEIFWDKQPAAQKFHHFNQAIAVCIGFFNYIIEQENKKATIKHHWFHKMNHFWFHEKHLISNCLFW